MCISYRLHRPCRAVDGGSRDAETHVDLCLLPGVGRANEQAGFVGLTGQKRLRERRGGGGEMVALIHNHEAPRRTENGKVGLCF